MLVKKPLISCLFLFGILTLKDTIFSLFLLLFFLYYLYEYKLINKISIFMLCFILFHSSTNYSILNHIVLETHQNYVIASVNHEKVLIYTDEVYFFGEKIEVNSKKQEIDSLSNFYIFNFKEYMNKMNIKYCYSNANIKKGDSIQRKMYEYINTFDEETKNILLKIFYQFDANQNIVYSSGMHYSYINQSLFQFFNQYLSQSISYCLSSIFISVFGILFPFKFSLFRTLVGNFIKIFMNEQSKKDKIGTQYLLCLCLFPSSVHSLSFIIPFILQLSRLFIKEKSLKSLSTKLFLVFIQLYKSNSCQLMPILFFQLFQRFNSMYFILTLIQTMIPIPFIHYLEFIIQTIESYILSISIYGHVPILLFIGFLYHYVQLIYNHKKKVIAIVIILLMIPLQGYLNPFYTITFINVGQGDSILIQAPFNLNNTLIDIPLNKEDVVIDYLHAIGVHKINQLVFTHSDSDHNGGKDLFIQKFKVDHVIEEINELKIFNQKLMNVNQTIHEDDNDQSIVLFGSVGKMNVCLMGDASKKVERNIIEHYDFTCNVLKVGHHGSQTSTDPLFIQNVEPDIAIISAGKNNFYGHPHRSVMDTLKRYKAKTYETKNGAIMIKNFLKLQIIKTSNGEFDIIIL